MPWLAAIGVGYAVFGRFFASDLHTGAQRTGNRADWGQYTGLPVLAVVALTPSGAGGVLAVLLGVNIGPNLTYAGSLATLLWRRVLRQHGSAPDLGEFTRLGLLIVPAALVLGVLALWGGLHLLGG